MRLSQLFSRIPYETTSDLSAVEADRIEYDSRKALPGTLFVCLVGAHSDGHDYARHAYENGCRAFLASRPLDLPPDAAVAVTADTREALAVISADFYGRPAERLHLIGITGTKGKTTSALMLTAILNEAGLPCAYIGSNGVLIGERHIDTVNTTPESRDLHFYFDIMVKNGIRYVVMEVSSQALAHFRVHGLTFETAVFTNFSPDHIGKGEHPDLADYLASKAKLFSDYGCRHVVYNADDAMWREITGGAAGADRIGFSVGTPADFSAWNVEPYRARTTLGIAFDCIRGGWTTRVTLRTPGEFSVHNALSAIAAASVYGVSVERAAAVLAKTSVQGRFEIVEGLSDRTFILDYAHNALSLSSALTVLRAYHPTRLICLFGSVGGRTQGRRAELGSVASAMADLCIVTSDNPDYEPPEEIIGEIMRYFNDKCPHVCIADREAAIRYAVRISQPGDIILFAGKGHENYQLIAGKKIPFSERKIIHGECAQIVEETLVAQSQGR